MRYFIRLSYNGANYHGWQYQPNAITVQETLEEAFFTLLRYKVEIAGCGRTDKGVHASDYVAHCDLREIPENMDIVFKLNCILPSDIAIKEMFEVKEDFHARFLATSRSYHYYICQSKNPFAQHMAYEYKNGLDLQTLNKIAMIFTEFQEFKPFCKVGSDNKGYTCYVKESYWEELSFNGYTYIRYTITANRFLRGMIRLIVGAHINVLRGKYTIEDLIDILKQQTSLPIAWSVPADGLYLTNILYDLESIRK